MSPKDAPSGKRAAEASSPKENARRPALILLIACLMLLVGMIIYTYVGPRGPPPQTSSTAIPGVPGVGGPFTMTDSEGRPATEAILKGKWSVVFFGYTQCPDVCPTTLAELVEVRKLLGADGDRLQALFITIDPERDTPEVLKAYVANFDPGFLALRPDSPEQLAALAKDFKVYYKKAEGRTPTSYTMDHSAGSYVYDTKGKLRLYTRYGSGAPALASDMRQLLR